MKLIINIFLVQAIKKIDKIEKQMTIDHLIKEEKLYFQPMLDRQRRATLKQREAWRLETIAQRQERISLETYDICDGVVKYGPFKGLLLNRDTWWGRLDLGSQCLGLYEKEVLDFFSRVSSCQFKTFIDIGAADGYYVNGVLTSSLINNVICYESSQSGREAIDANWRINGAVGDLEIKGEANCSSILGLPVSILDKCLIIVDIEGFEFELLNFEVLSFLRTCVLIIEIHNWVDDFEYKYENFLRNAAEFFSIDILKNVERFTSDIPELRSYTDDNRALLISERRPCLMRFLKLAPK